MPLKYKTNAGAGDYDPIPAGTHIAICDIVADIGIQPGSTLYPKPKQQVYIRFELPNERVEFERDGKKQTGPAVIGKTYTASMNEKATLRAHLESWRGKEFADPEAEDFDVSAILGKPCVLNITQSEKSGKTYSNITGIGKLMKGVDPKTLLPEITPIYYGPDNTALYAQLPEWLRKKIDGQILEPKTSQNHDAESQGNSYDPMEITDDDIPF